MIIEFVAASIADRDVLVVPVATGGLANVTEHLPESFRSVAAGAAEQARFDGAAGSVFETFVAEGPLVRRLILVGIGNGDDAAYEKAGAGVTARLIISGAASVYVDLASATAEGAARFALGATLRGWRIDRYRTRLPVNQKPTLERIAIAGAADGAGQRPRARDPGPQAAGDQAGGGPAGRRVHDHSAGAGAVARAQRCAVDRGVP